MSGTERSRPQSGHGRAGLLRRGAEAAVMAAATGAVLLMLAAPAGRRDDAWQKDEVRIEREAAEAARKRSAVTVVWSVGVDKPEYFITIDDGWYPNRGVLDVMRRQRVPITTFLIRDAMEGDLPFWREFIRLGGHVEDHTVSHPDLDSLASRYVEAQIDGSSRAIERQLGERVYLFRPPYGAYDTAVTDALARDSIHSLVMWDKWIPNHMGGYGEDLRIHPFKGGPVLAKGDIVLLHWEPGVDRALRFVLEQGRKEGLVPGDLLKALSGYGPNPRFTGRY